MHSGSRGAPAQWVSERGSRRPGPRSPCPVPESGLRSEGPLEPGSIGYTRVGDVEGEWRVVSYVENEGAEWEITSGPFLGKGGYRLVAVDGSTQFTLLSDVEPAGVYKLLGPLFGWIGRRRNQADVEKLREILESTPD